MGATQGSAGSEPREPAGGAEQVGSLPRARSSSCRARPPAPPAPAVVVSPRPGPRRGRGHRRGSAAGPAPTAGRGGCGVGRGRGGASVAPCEEGGRVCNAYLQVFACISHPLNVPPPPSQAGTPRPSGGEAVRMRGRAGLVRDSGLLPSSPPPRVAGGAAGAEGRWKSRVFSVKSERGASGRRARAAGRSALGNAGLFLTS